MKNKEVQRAYYFKNKEKICQKARKWAKDNRERKKELARKRYARLSPEEKKNRRRYPFNPQVHYKKEVIGHYGGLCACCGEANLAFLSIDHINDNGREHKGLGRTRYKGLPLYRYLKNHNYPEGIQVLCLNCNIGKKNNKGTCPHKIISD